MADPLTLEQILLGAVSAIAGGGAVIGFRNVRITLGKNGKNGNGYVTKDQLQAHCSVEHKAYGEALVRIEQRLEHGDKQLEALAGGIKEMAANSADVAKQIGTLTGHVEALRGK